MLPSATEFGGNVGQAKQRGTLEERKQQALLTNENNEKAVEALQSDIKEYYRYCVEEYAQLPDALVRFNLKENE